MSLFRILHVQLLLPPRYGDAKSAHCIELKINSDRMPTSSETDGERATKEERRGQARAKGIQMPAPLATVRAKVVDEVQKWPGEHQGPLYLLAE